MVSAGRAVTAGGVIDTGDMIVWPGNGVTSSASVGATVIGVGDAAGALVCPLAVATTDGEAGSGRAVQETSNQSAARNQPIHWI